MTERRNASQNESVYFLLSHFGELKLGHKLSLPMVHSRCVNESSMVSVRKRNKPFWTTCCIFTLDRYLGIERHFCTLNKIIAQALINDN